MTTATTIPVARPLLDEREAEAARRVILSGWVTQGPEVAAFERDYAEAVGAPHACAVSSCTTALHLALVACGVSNGDEVVTVSHSFIATANAVRYCGATPVFVDVQRDTFNIDPALVEAAIGPRTKAILAVHQFGMPCDLAAIVEIGSRRSIPVVEDAACAAGSEIRWNDRWERIGRPRGLVACFSFHPRKLLSTGDGGMLTTADPDLDRRFRLLRHHGMSVSDTVRHSASTVIQEEYSVLGYNYRMTDIQAAIGREQLKRLPEIVSRRRVLAARYDERLATVPGVTTPTEPSWGRTNWQSYVIRVQADRQRHIMQKLLDAGISTRKGAMNAHREAAYPPNTWRQSGSLKESESAQDSAIVLPLFHQLTESDQDRVIDELTQAVGIRA
ncbi:MAG TPA: DegT/DnrJ/EryC1/StrS family aminotransferase [Vicinamibacterales bacterium]|nr:DegT/DnrJ/EryC1/StrS family aminotransferase [Vicinamibacterales bacterium]